MKIPKMNRFWIVPFFWLLVVGGLFLSHVHIFILPHQTFKLKTSPVDPRDFFRGDYVVLHYGGLQQIKLPQGTEGFHAGETLYIQLQKDKTGFATLNTSNPVSRVPRPDALQIKARVNSPGHTAISVDLGLHQYFVKEGTGSVYESSPEPLVVSVVANSKGEARIKDVQIPHQ
jgi:uncharacterized membrane-anchored protein